jgi:glycosyltransferase involved in cell wall biosynthesis
MKVALVHYWLVSPRGGEKVLEALCELFPEADVFTHVYDEAAFVDSAISKHKIVTSFISRLPFAKRFYQSYLPLMPLALESLDLSGYDLIISSESGPAKGIIPPPGGLHVCYCHSPMRYAWDMYHAYKDGAGFFKRLFMVPIMHYIRRWDQLAAAQADYFVANSGFVAGRINRYYRRSADVIYPPVSVENFAISDDVGDYYLLLGQLVRYKRADLAVRAFTESGKKLLVVGEGELDKKLRNIAGPNIIFKGRASLEKLKVLMSSCRALIFPGVEDFGIVPLEAMASGRPVIAYSEGGALETVVPGKTGIFFNEQTVESLNSALVEFEQKIEQFDPLTIRLHAEKFSRERFLNEFGKYIDEKVALVLESSSKYKIADKG